MLPPSPVVRAINAALHSPYAHTAAPHYAHAYATTPDGYTLSATYKPAAHQTAPPPSQPGTRRPAAASSHHRSGAPQRGHWYEPGNRRCTHQQCVFTGSNKSVEIHMMDRHLIYPPGWERRKPMSDWDADPSLKGKPIPIQGTGIILDTPEAVDAWIAERRKRWPSAAKVQEKEKHLKDAIARGQISADDPSIRGHKRRRPDQDGQQPNIESHRGPWRGRGRGQVVGGHERPPDSGWRGRGRGRGAHHQALPAGLPLKPQTLVQAVTVADSDSESSGSDMDPEKDAISFKIPPAPLQDAAHQAMKKEQSHEGFPIPTAELMTITTNSIQPSNLPQRNRKPVPEPRNPPFNPFAARPSLLRNLLLPEIRMTVSNLSQAIRFIVDNDFFEGVELKPGEASKKPIEILSETFIGELHESSNLDRP